MARRGVEPRRRLRTGCQPPRFSYAADPFAHISNADNSARGIQALDPLDVARANDPLGRDAADLEIMATFFVHKQRDESLNSTIHREHSPSGGV